MMLKKPPRLTRLQRWGSEAGAVAPAASFCPLENTSGKSLLEPVTALRQPPPPRAKHWRRGTLRKTPARLKPGTMGKAGCAELPSNSLLLRKEE